VTTALEQLAGQGYLVLPGVLSDNELEEIRATVDELLAREKEHPFEPKDGPPSSGDSEIEKFFSDSYTVSRAELDMLMRRVRHTRAENLGTPWPVPPNQVIKMFLHLPILFDQDKSQRVQDLPAKSERLARLIEHPQVLELVRGVLGPDCVLSDFSVNCIGAKANEGGAWHVDVPLGQLPEPLPDFPLTVQNVFMLDDFTPENGATRVVTRSHLLRRKPSWISGAQPDEVILTAPAGSVAIWLSNTWHRSGPNTTDRPRRALLGYYSRSWVKPFNDYRLSIPRSMVERFSPTLRYLLGFSANCPALRG